jgi:AcrR family transcriptional regulator
MPDNITSPALEPDRPTVKGRDRLIMVAMQLFAERGFDGVTVRDIAKEAGVSIGLINHHFVSKEGLRAAVDAHFLERTSKAIARGAREVASADLDTVAEYQRNWIRQYADEWAELCRLPSPRHHGEQRVGRASLPGILRLHLKNDHAV